MTDPTEAPRSWTEPVHRHERSCYWDHRRAAWTCRGPEVALAPVTAALRPDCLRLGVRPEQRRFVADVGWYLDDCAEGGVWQPVAAVRAGRVEGFAVWATDEDGTGWIGGVVVDASAQGRGTGRRLLELLMARLVEGGATSLGLTVAPENTGARGLYHSLGFVETDERDGDEIVARWSGAPAGAEQ